MPSRRHGVNLSNIISFRESIKCFVFMLKYPLINIICHTGIKNSIVSKSTYTFMRLLRSAEAGLAIKKYYSSLTASWIDSTGIYSSSPLSL